MENSAGGEQKLGFTAGGSRCFGGETASSLTRVSLAEHLDGRGHFLLADVLVLLPLGRSLEALPGQRAQVEVHEDVAQGLQVVPSGLLCGRERSVNAPEL